MKKRINNLFRYVLFGLIISVAFGQSSGYLAQKLILENSLRKRIGDALEKVIDNRKYVVDVSVDLEISSIKTAVKKTCESIAEDPSWVESLRYNYWQKMFDH